MKRAASALLSTLLVGFSSQTPTDLGRYAALNEVAYGTLGDKDNYRAGQFMAAWYKACEAARDEMRGSPFMKTLGDEALSMSKTNEEFSDAYIAARPINRCKEAVAAPRCSTVVAFRYGMRDHP